MARLSSAGTTEEQASFISLIEYFLADLRQANHSANTLRAYASDL